MYMDSIYSDRETETNLSGTSLHVIKCVQNKMFQQQESFSQDNITSLYFIF